MPYGKAKVVIKQEFTSRICPFCKHETIMFGIHRGIGEEGQPFEELFVIGNERTFCPHCGKREWIELCDE